MAVSTRLLGSGFAVLATCLVFGCGPKKEPDQPKKKASDGLDLELMGEVSSTPGEGSASRGGGDDLDEPFSSCAKKKCGDVCTTCDPVEESCVEVQILRQCSLKGECVIAPAQCTAPAEDKAKDKAKGK